MCSETAIKVAGLGKCYHIYDTPQARLKQFIGPRISRIFGRKPRQYFHEYWALRDVSFQVGRAETVGIIGRNGSGKSTLLQLICGTLNQTSGHVETNGRIAALLELGSGFNPEFTGTENVYMNAALLGLSREQIDARYDAIVAFADIGDFIHQPVKTYSSGMMVRLAFSVIAHVDADILIIDEALAVGDAFFSQKCMRFLRDFMQTGTVLFVSHDTGAVRSLCTRVIWLEKGTVMQSGDPKEVSNAYLQAFYEAQQGKSTSTRIKASVLPQPDVFRDARNDFINHSNLRNDIQIFKFNMDAASFGAGGAQIVNTVLLDVQRNALAWIVGGEDVIVQVSVLAHTELTSPIIGFCIKDRHGQELFGDNTWLSHLEQPVTCVAGEHLIAEFHFNMPRLAAGDYFITVAIAEGSQENHVQHHWIHEAMMFKSQISSVASGIIGINMKQISLEKYT